MELISLADDFRMPQTRSSAMKQTRLTFTPVPSSSPIGTPEKRAAFARNNPSSTPSKPSGKATSSASKPNSKLKISPVENVVLPTPAPSSQIDQKYEESSDSTQSESEIPVGSRIFGRHARRETSGSNMLPLSPRSSKKSSSNEPISSESAIYDETLKRNVDEGKTPFRTSRRRLFPSVTTLSSSSNDNDAKPSLFKRKIPPVSSDKRRSSSSNEGSSEDIISPIRRKRRIIRSMPDSSEKDPDSHISRNEIVDDLREDLDDLRDSSEFFFEHMLSIDFTYVYYMLAKESIA